MVLIWPVPAAGALAKERSSPASATRGATMPIRRHSGWRTWWWRTWMCREGEAISPSLLVKNSLPAPFQLAIPLGVPFAPVEDSDADRDGERAQEQDRQQERPKLLGWLAFQQGGAHPFQHVGGG